MVFYQESYDGVQGLRYFATSGTSQLPGLQQPLLVYPGSVFGAGPVIIPTQVKSVPSHMALNVRFIPQILVMIHFFHFFLLCSILNFNFFMHYNF